MSRYGLDRMSPELAERFERDALPYQGQLLRAAMQLTKHRQDAEDLVQESIARACAAFHRFTPGTNVRAWLHRILLNTFINGYRKRQREPLLTVSSVEELAVGEQCGLPASSMSAEDAVLSKIPAHRLVTALQSLPKEFRQVLYLIDVEGFSYRETAVIMDTPLGTVMSRLHRARTSLRAGLSEPANGVFESPEQGERMGTRRQEDPHVQRHNGSSHRGGDNRDRADHCLHDHSAQKAPAAAVRS